MADVKNPERLRPRRSVSSRKSTSAAAGRARSSTASSANQTPLVTEDDIQALLNWRPSFETPASADISELVQPPPPRPSSPTPKPAPSHAGGTRSRPVSTTSSNTASRRGSLNEDIEVGDDKWEAPHAVGPRHAVFDHPPSMMPRVPSPVEEKSESNTRDTSPLSLHIDPVLSPRSVNGDMMLSTTSSTTPRKSRFAAPTTAPAPNLLVKEPLDQDLKDLLHSERITAMATSSRILAVGTLMGMIHLFTLSGHKIKTISIHFGQITDLCLLADDSFLASSSVDGSILILDPWESSNSTLQTFSSPVIPSHNRCEAVFSVSLCHSFAAKPRFCYISQISGLFTLTTSFFGGYKDTNLYSNLKDPCFVVRWSPQDPSNPSSPGFIAWSTNSMVYIYSYLDKKVTFMLERSSFSTVTPDVSPTTRDYDDDEGHDSDAMQCFLEWENAHRLMVGWDDGVQVVELVSFPMTPASKDALSSPTNVDQNVLRIKISASFQLQDHWVLAVTSLDAYFVVLAWPKGSSIRHVAKTSQADKPTEAAELLLVNRYGVVVSAHCIKELKLSRDFGLGSFRLTCSKGDENLYFVMNPDSIAAIRIQNADVVIDKFLGEKKLKEAVELAVMHKDALRTHRAIDLIDTYINQLLSDHDFDTAADVCVKYAKRDKDRWSRWLLKFMEVDQIQVIVEDIPIEKPRLKKKIYTDILLRLVKTDHDCLVRMVRKWPPLIYETKPIVVAVEEELKTEFSAALTEVLTKLYLREGKVGVAINTYAQLRQTLMESTKIADEVLKLSKNASTEN